MRSISGSIASTRPDALTRYGATGHYAVTKQWATGTPWLLVFTIKQGKHEAYNTAEVFVRVSAIGRDSRVPPRIVIARAETSASGSSVW